MNNNQKVIFMPQDQTDPHPYQKQLSVELSSLGVDFSSLGFKSIFLFDVLNQKIDTLHLHWLHAYLVKSTLIKSLGSTFIFLSQLFILRLLGIKIVWTVHNLKNHESRSLFLDWFGTACVARLSHTIIAHCECAKKDIINHFQLKKSEKVLVIPHGNFSNYYENSISRLDARKHLNIDDSEFVILFLGLIRSYKGIPELLDAFEQLKEDNVRLLIAGKLYSEELALIRLLEEKNTQNIQISFIPGYISDNEIQIYMNAADVVVFPYRSILTSGAVLLAMSFSRACIAPRIGCIGEVLDDQGSFLYDPDAEMGLLNCLQKAIQNHSKLEKMGQHNFQLAEKFNWTHIAKMTSEVYQHCLQK